MMMSLKRLKISKIFTSLPYLLVFLLSVWQKFCLYKIEGGEPILKTARKDISSLLILVP
jgi:hypothetical protein